MSEASFHLEPNHTRCKLFVCGDWRLGYTPEGTALSEQIPPETTELELMTTELGQWDSSLAIILLQLANECKEKNIAFNMSTAPQGLQQLIRLATDVPAYENAKGNDPTPLSKTIRKKLLTLPSLFKSTKRKNLKHG